MYQCLRLEYFRSQFYILRSNYQYLNTTHNARHSFKDSSTDVCNRYELTCLYYLQKHFFHLQGTNGSLVKNIVELSIKFGETIIINSFLKLYIIKSTPSRIQSHFHVKIICYTGNKQIQQITTLEYNQYLHHHGYMHFINVHSYAESLVLCPKKGHFKNQNVVRIKSFVFSTK